MATALLQRSMAGPGFGRAAQSAETLAGAGPAIGPPPDGSDPSRPQFVGLGGRGGVTAGAVILRRAER